MIDMQGDEKSLAACAKRREAIMQNGLFAPSLLEDPAAQTLLQQLGQDVIRTAKVVDAIEQCIQLMEATTLADEERYAHPQAGEGGAVTEAPRGLLYHGYRLDRKGVVEQAKIVTPTSHNFRVIERDLQSLVARHRGVEKPKLRLLCEQLVRAYDPCFSCSVH